MLDIRRVVVECISVINGSMLSEVPRNGARWERVRSHTVRARDGGGGACDCGRRRGLACSAENLGVLGLVAEAADYEREARRSVDAP